MIDALLKAVNHVPGFYPAWERGRPARIIGQAEGEPWRRSRLIQVGEMAEAVPGLVRAGRPRSQQAVIP